jgi:hypothetical protein
VIDMLKRHAIQVLRTAGHTLDEIGDVVGVGKRSVQRVIREPAITHHDEAQERGRRGIGRPSKAEAFRVRVEGWLKEEPELRTVELLHRAKLAGYDGAKSALYELVRAARVVTPRPVAARRIHDDQKLGSRDEHSLPFAARESSRRCRFRRSTWSAGPWRCVWRWTTTATGRKGDVPYCHARGRRVLRDAALYGATAVVGLYTATTYLAAHSRGGVHAGERCCPGGED